MLSSRGSRSRSRSRAPRASPIRRSSRSRSRSRSPHNRSFRSRSRERDRERDAATLVEAISQLSVPSLSAQRRSTIRARITTLLDRGASPNESQAMLTPLIQAIRLGDLDLIRDLLEHGARVNANEMRLAIVRRNVEMIRLLLRHGGTVPADMLAFMQLPEMAAHVDALHARRQDDTVVDNLGTVLQGLELHFRSKKSKGKKRSQRNKIKHTKTAVRK